MLLERPAPIATAPLHLVERADPAPAAGEVLIAVTACGVCRTDLQLCEGDLPLRRSPVVPGHQIVGRVLATGPDATAFVVGDRVGVGWLGGACGTCTHCLTGRENLCESTRFTGWDRDGGYGTRVTASASFVHLLPHTLDDVSAAPLLCGGVIGYRSLRVSGIRPGGRLGLFGFGASALLTIQVARYWGCEVFVVTRSEREQARARALGASWTGGYGDRVPVALDAAITFAPSGDVVVAALKSLGRGGTVAINAIHLDRIPQLSYDDLWWERSLRSVANFTRDDAREFLALAAEIPVRTTFETHPLDRANEALARLSRGDVEGAVVLVCA